MPLKRCRVCGAKFPVRGIDVTCGPECRRTNRLRQAAAYRDRNRAERRRKDNEKYAANVEAFRAARKAKRWAKRKAALRVEAPC